jgi:hypothetical protein
MKKIIYTAIVSIFTSSFALGSTDQTEILFCTKNLGDPSFSNSVSMPQVPAGHAHRKQMDAYDVLDHKQHGYVVDLRHCFMAMASVDKKSDGIVTLSELQTQGFGQITNPRHGQRTGGVYQEMWNGNEVVGCVPVLSVKKEASPYAIWIKVLEYMANAAHQQDYSVTDYNCCTVAYGAVSHIGGNMDAIDPTRFNLLGIGVVWKGNDLKTAEGLSNKVSVWTGISYDFSSKKTSQEDGTKSPASADL